MSTLWSFSWTIPRRIWGKRLKPKQIRLSLDIWKTKSIKLQGLLTLIRTVVKLLLSEFLENKKCLHFKDNKLNYLLIPFSIYVSVDESVKESNLSLTEGPVCV